MHTAKQPETPWTLSVDEITEILSVDSSRGLSNADVKQRRKTFGPNRIRHSKGKSAWKILVDQFTNLIMLVLAAAAILSFAFAQWVDGIAIIVAMIINAVVGFITELKATRSMEALQQMDMVTAMVKRDGEVHEIPARDIVPGDVMVFESGDMVSADIRLTESNKLQANESPLTGESVPVAKTIEPLDGDIPLAERANMLYKGTSITRGSGEGIAVLTGMDTEIGTIASLVDEAEAKSDPLEKQLDGLAKSLIKVIFFVAIFAGIAGILSGKDLLLMIKTAVVLIVAAIPEGLPVVATVALARGMKQMADENALVRRLTAVQTLGSTNVIFTDKTGTLTENQMTMTEFREAGKVISISGEGLSTEGSFSIDDSEFDPSEDPVLVEALKTGMLCTNASIKEDDEGQTQDIGDPMEVALIVAGAKAGLDRIQLLEQMPEEKEIAFDPANKMMATYNSPDDNPYRVSVKGAPESVLEACTTVNRNGNIEDMDSEERSRWIDLNTEMARDGLRVLAMAVKTTGTIDEDPYSGLTFLGLSGLVDPPRGDIKNDMKECDQAGIRVIMLTGDHQVTAAKVGSAVGIIEDENSPVKQGSEIEDISSLTEEQMQDITRTPIFCRVSPKQKLNLISIYQEKNNIVAMTGDGVNDAPALKKSDIGVAMGKRGQQVAKEAADIILQDDDFTTILTAVKHGRTIFNNIRKFVIYLISGNLGEILIVTLASVAGQPLPLLPLQILYLNAINDAFPALALGMGKAGHGIMKKPPRDPGEPIMGRRQWYETLWYGALIAAAVLTGFMLALYHFDLGKEAAVTVSFLSLALGRLWHVFNMRDIDSTFFRNRILTNPYVIGALVLCTGLILMAVYIPILSQVLKVAIPGTTGWILLLVTSIVPLIVGQVVLFIRRKTGKKIDQ